MMRARTSVRPYTCMTYDPEKHHRRSIRLRGYDYSSAGVYFLTICTQQRACLFGEVAEGAMQLNAGGRMIAQWWQELSHKFPAVLLDEYVVMPNHFHGILGIFNDTDARIAPGLSLSAIVQWFKTMTTNAYIHGVNHLGWPRFVGRLWQRNYFEHIIRDDHSFHNIRNYIRANPLMWPQDIENPRPSAANADDIQRAIAQRYGFTDEELDFISDFDHKLRMKP